MKKIIFTLTFSILSIISFSQTFQSVEEVDETCANALGFQSDYEAEKVVDDILDKVGLFPNFVIQQCPNINNAVAVSLKNKEGLTERFILYDNDFFEKIGNGDDYAAIFILAHEIGHHLNGHSLNNQGSNHQFELEADYFAGRVLALMGYTLEQSLTALNAITYEKATRTHPAKADRIAMATKGYNKAGGKKIEKIDQAIEHEIIENNIDNEEVTKTVTAEQVISKYLNAIGGKENIAKIKALRRKYNCSLQGMEIQIAEEHVNSFTQYMNVSMANSILNETLTINNRSFVKNAGQWGEVKGQGQGQGFSVGSKSSIGAFIPEMGLLINDLKLDFLGTEEVDGKMYYKITFTENENRITKYYDVATGLLYRDEVVSSEGKLITGMTYTSYGEFSGVKFPVKIMLSTGSETDFEMSMDVSDISINPKIDRSILDAIETVKSL